MPDANLVPVWAFSMVDANSKVMVGAKLNTYVAGSVSTALQTFKESTLTTPHLNPVVADSAGRFGEPVYAQNRQYKFVLTDASDNVLQTIDPWQPNSLVDPVATYAALKALDVGLLTAGVAIYVDARAVAGDGGDGHFMPTQSNPGADNDGTILLSDTAGWWFVRQFSGRFNARWFGVHPDNTSTANDAGFVSLFAAVTSSGTTGTGDSPYLPGGDHLILSAIQSPNATAFVGDGRWQSRILADTGFTGKMFEDTGNAGKIWLRGLGFDAQNEAGVTDIISLGQGATPWGEGGAEDLIVRAGTTAHATSRGMVFEGNVVSLTEVEELFNATAFEETADSTTIVYDRCFANDNKDFSFKLNQNSLMNGCEIEAPPATNVGVSVNRSAVINGLTYSQSPSVTNPHAIELGASATDGGFSMTGFRSFDGGATATLTDIIKDNRAAFPTNWGDAGGTADRASAYVGDRVFVGDYVGVVDAEIHSGTGSPEGVVTAPVGSIYLRDDGGPGTIVYRKNTGAGNTGWQSDAVNILGSGTELTIATGAITVTESYHKVDTESDAGTDDLDTISGGTLGQILVLEAADATRDVTLRNLQDNINLSAAGNFILDATADKITLIYNGTNWDELSRSGNA